MNSTLSFPPKEFGSGKYWLIYTMSFLSIQLLKGLSHPFHWAFISSPFLFITFSNLKSFWNVFFVKRSKKIFSFTVTNNVCPRHSIFFNSFSHKNVFTTIWNIAFCKNVFIFRYSNSIINFKSISWFFY